VQVLFTKVSEYAREQLKTRIEETVTAALTAVFGEGYTFRINMRQLGNQPAAEWQVVSQYGDEEVAASPEDARGGGITDVVSLALRLAMLEILKPRPEGPVLFDEPAKDGQSAEYAGNLAYFLKQYAEKTERQVVMVTHNPQLAEAADKSYLVTQKDGVSEVREILIRRKGRKMKWSGSQVKRLRELCYLGASNKEIAADIGCSLRGCLFAKRSQLGITIAKCAAVKELHREKAKKQAWRKSCIEPEHLDELKTALQ
jgi:hypothetical protein